MIFRSLSLDLTLMLKVVFGLAYRQTEGFASSILKIMGTNVTIPSYSQLNRRAKTIDVDWQIPEGVGIHIVFDSTGLKVFGEGEWKVRKHGVSKRRTWRKLHLGVDEESGLIHAVCLTKNDIDDAGQVAEMLDQV